MRRFYKNVLFFVTPVVVLLLYLPVDNRLKYAGLAEDCAGHGKWMYQRIFQNPTPIDIAAIGSSHTISGLNDQLINEYTADFDLHFTTLGYCRLGRNMSYAILQELLQKKAPKYVIVEVRADEDRYSHPIFPYIADTREVLFPELLFNRDYLADLSAHLTYKVELAQDYIFNPVPEFNSDKGDFGFGTTDDTLSRAEVQSILQKRKQGTSADDNLSRSFYMKYPRSYLQKLAALCKDHHIQLFFLYLPSFGAPPEKPKEHDTYLRYAPVLLPPDSIFINPDHWHDSEHLNPAGAKALSLWLVREIETIVRSR